MARRTTEIRSEKMLDMAASIEDENGPIDMPERYTQDGIADRRHHVKRFLARHVPQTVMAELLGVSRRTIYEDVQAIRAAGQERMELVKSDTGAAALDIGMSVLRMEGMQACAMNDYELARTAQMKNLFLNTAMKAEKIVADIKVATGVWPKAGEEIRITHNIKATFSAKFGADSPLAKLDNADSRRKVLAAAEQILRLSGRGKPGLDLPIVILDDDDDMPPTIDITGEVKDGS